VRLLDTTSDLEQCYWRRNGTSPHSIQCKGLLAIYLSVTQWGGPPNRCAFSTSAFFFRPKAHLTVRVNTMEAWPELASQLLSALSSLVLLPAALLARCAWSPATDDVISLYLPGRLSLYLFIFCKVVRCPSLKCPHRHRAPPPPPRASGFASAPGRPRMARNNAILWVKTNAALAIT
jgi:hypothetical protein